MDNLEKVNMDTVLSMGKPMPSIGLGGYFGKPDCVNNDEVQTLVESAVDIGYRHFDTAFFYNTEVPIGRALNAKIDSGVITREDLFVTSKLNFDSHHPDEVKNNFNETMKYMDLDYLDLYLIHFPAPVIKNAEGPIKSRPYDEQNDFVTVWKVLEGLVNQGHVRAIGVSNFNRTQIDKLLKHCTIKPVVNQVEVHLYNQCKELREHNKDRGVKVMAHSPLGLGYSPPANWESPLDDPVVEELAKKYKKSPAQLSLRFLVQQGLMCIPGSLNAEQQLENINIFDFEIEDVDMQKLRSIDRKKRKVKLTSLKGHKDYPFNEPF